VDDSPRLEVIRTATVRATGGNHSRPPRQAERGALVKVRAGVYAPSEMWHRLAEDEQHRLLVVETARRVQSEDASVSHLSSAVMWGIPHLGKPPAQVQLTTVHRGGSPPTHTRHHRTGSVPPTVMVDGVRCTSPARTVVDIARTLSFASALMAMDDALRRGLATVAEIQEAIEQLGRARGVNRAALVLSHADALSESPGESLSRARMIQLGVPTPVLQFVVRDQDGVAGRVDYWWEAQNLAGEFDGAVKYGLDRSATGARETRSGGGASGDPRVAAGGALAAEVVHREKLREDRIRAARDCRMLRWTWDDAYDLPRFGAIMRRAGLLSGEPAPDPRYLY